MLLRPKGHSKNKTEKERYIHIEAGMSNEKRESEGQTNLQSSLGCE
jgi:hypothetical protein